MFKELKACKENKENKGDAGEPSWDEIRILELEARIFNLEQGCDSDLVDNGNGTITDNCTNLVWLRQVGTGLSGSQAITYCENLVFASYDDWYLPNMIELMTIVDYTKQEPASSDLFEYQPYVPPNPPVYIVRSSSRIVDFGHYISVDFKYGLVGFHGDSNGFTARCVR